MIDGGITYIKIISAFAICPTPKVDEPIRHKSSFIIPTQSAAIGPYIKPASIINTFEKSNFKKNTAEVGNSENSKKETAYASATKIAIPAMLLVVKTFFIKNAPNKTLGA